jgi:hypothetical protein
MSNWLLDTSLSSDEPHSGQVNIDSVAELAPSFKCISNTHGTLIRVHGALLEMLLIGLYFRAEMPTSTLTQGIFLCRQEGGEFLVLPFRVCNNLF